MLTSPSSSSSSSPISFARSSAYQAHAYHSPLVSSNSRVTSSSLLPSDPQSRSGQANRVTSQPPPKRQADPDNQSTSVAEPQIAQHTTIDAGTQYTPPDWPPTDTRSSLHAYNKYQRSFAPSASALTVSLNQDTLSSSSEADHPATATLKPSPPPEPQARITPHTSLHNAARRGHSEGSSSGGTTSDTPTANKRAKQAATGMQPRLVPRDYTTCDPKVLASIIAEMLLRLIQHNDAIPLRDGQLTRFHSRAPPGISVRDYLARLQFHATLSPPILLSMVFFIDRLSSNFPTFIINSLTVHRFLITAATVASKGLSDSFWTNQTYARVGGVSIKELALLELELLMKCDWKIIPGAEQLVEYYNGLVEQSEEWELDPEPSGIDIENGDGVEQHDTSSETLSSDDSSKTAATVT